MRHDSMTIRAQQIALGDLSQNVFLGIIPNHVGHSVDLLGRISMVPLHHERRKFLFAASARTLLQRGEPFGSLLTPSSICLFEGGLVFLVIHLMSCGLAVFTPELLSVCISRRVSKIR